MANQVKKVLLIGSSFSALPMLKVLKSRGFYVAVCGAATNDPCHLYADESLFINYSDIDSFLSIFQETTFDYVVPSSNDAAYLAGVQASKIYGFPGFDRESIANIIFFKNQFRSFCKDNALPAPQGFEIDISDIETFSVEALTIDYPLIVKPVDAFSGKGVTKVTESTTLLAAIERAGSESKSRRVVIEEFVDGTLHSHSAFFSKQAIYKDFFVDEYCSVYPYQVNCSNHPSFLSDNIKEQIRMALSQMVKTLGLEDGLLHTQFITNGSKVWVIESMRRCPGDLYPRLIESSTNTPYIDLYLRPYLNIDYKDASVQEQNKLKNIARHTVSSSTTVLFQAFSSSVPATLIDIVPLKNSGELLKEAPFDKVAILFFHFDTSEEMFKYTPEMQKYIHIGEF